MPQSIKETFFNHLESLGTKIYTSHEAEQMLSSIGFSNIRMVTKVAPGALLDIKQSQQYQNPIVKLIWKLYLRWLIKKTGDRFGFYLLNEAIKQT